MIRDVKLICLSNLVCAFGDGFYSYILPNLIRARQATPAQVGLTYAVLNLASAITPIPGGFLADRWDRKKLMILGLLIWMPVPLLFSVAQHWTLMMPIMFLYGFFLSGPANSAYLATAVDKKEVTQAYTMVAASWWFGYVFSPAFGGYLSKSIGMNWVFYLSFIFFSFAMIILFFIKNQYPQKTGGKVSTASDSLRVRRVLILSVFLAAFVFFLTIGRPLIPQFFQDKYQLDSFYISVLGSVTFLGAALWCLSIGKLGNRWRRSTTISLASITYSISIITIILRRDFTVLCLSSFLSGASYTIWSLMGSLIAPITPEATRGRWISVSQTAAIIASLAASLVGGVLYQTWPYAPLIIAIVGCIALAILTSAGLLKEEKQSLL